MMRTAFFSGLLTLVIPWGLPWGLADAADAIPTYRATYDVSYRRRSVGSSEFSVTRDPVRDTYTFESTSRFKGLFRLLSPRPLVEVSEFAHDQGRIRPLAYSYQDGSRSGDDNYHVVFDWDTGTATTTVEGQTTQSELVPGVLDRGSMHVALMLDMQASVPDTYTLVDEGGVRVYEYSADGEATLDTPLGRILAQKFIQQRRGSSRRTVIWVARELNYLPIRIEQQRDGTTRAAFDLQSVEWLEALE